ncbi:MAG TPA: AAA family ATPase [Candidatus Dormibacteraeota bacterium]
MRTDVMSDNATITLLYTDMVGSTQLYDQLGDEVAERLRRLHFSLLRDTVSAHDGREVRQVGDGLKVAFSSAIDAIECAVEMQQAVHRHNERATDHALAVRIGLHAGEPILDEEDYFGTAVNVAKRLCDSAVGGQVIASDVVRALAGPRGQRLLRPMGALAIRGLRESMTTVEVVWRSAPGFALPLPVSLLTPGSSAFVGRDQVLRRLVDACDQARHGVRQLVLLSGEPGVGKTRLAAELAASAHAEGATVLHGRCDEEALLPYQPFVEALRHYVTQASTGELRAAVRGGARDAARLVPELHDRIPGQPPPGPDHPDMERYRLFESVAALLAQASVSAPLVLILDDLHWADRPTLHLLRHVMRSSEISSMLVLATCRDGEVGGSHPLLDTLVELRRVHHLRRIELTGLDRSAASALISSLAGGGSRDRLVDSLYGLTEGNPFFLEEVLRHLAEAEPAGPVAAEPSSALLEEMGIPAGVRDVVARRLARLSPDCRSLLALASAVGREFAFALLPGLTGMDAEAILDALEEAIGRRLLVEVRGLPEPRYAFSHGLVRQTLYEGLSTPRRQRAHWRAARAVDSAGGAPGSRALEVATHCRLAGGLADSRLVVEAASQAGDTAAAVFAWEEAARHWETALEVLDGTGGDASARARLLRRLGAAMFTSNLDYARGVACFERAMRLCEESGDHAGVAKMHAHLGGQYAANPEMTDIRRAEAHLRAAAPILARGPRGISQGYLRLAAASVALARMRSLEGLESSAEAMALADHCGDAPLWANAAAVHGWMLTADGRLDDGRKLMTRAWRVADEVHHHVSAFMATCLLCCLDSICLRDVDAGGRWAERELASQRPEHAPVHRRVLRSAVGYALALGGPHRRAERYAPSQSALFHVQYLLALGAGRWEDALRFLENARSVAADRGNRWYEAAEYCRSAAVLRLLDRPVEAEQSLRSALPVGSEDEVDVRLELWCRAQLALLLAEQGRSSEARSELDRCAGIRSHGAEWHGLGSAVSLTEAVVRAAEGRTTEADGLFESVTSLLRQQGLRWDEAEALHLHGRMLLAEGAPDRDRGLEHLETASSLYASLGANARWQHRVRAGVPGEVILRGRGARVNGGVHWHSVPPRA